MPDLDSRVTKKNTELTLVDKLSRLSYAQTLKLLGSDAPKLLRAGDKWDFRIEEDVYLGEDLFRLKFPLTAGERESRRVRYDQPDGRVLRPAALELHRCESVCEHVGAAFSLILEEKMALGLSAPPPERVAVESLSEQELVNRAIEDRCERARRNG